MNNRSLQGIKRLYNGEEYISVSIENAEILQDLGVDLLQFDSLKSIFVLQKDFDQHKDLLEL